MGSHPDDRVQPEIIDMSWYPLFSRFLELEIGQQKMESSLVYLGLRYQNQTYYYCGPTPSKSFNWTPIKEQGMKLLEEQAQHLMTKYKRQPHLDNGIPFVELVS